MPEDYEVSQGESIPSIAKDKGFFWKTLWNHGNNAELKNKRKNPNVLCPGDMVHIPDLQQKTETRGTDSRYKFLRKGEPVIIKIKLLKTDGTPNANVKYVLRIEDKEYKGNTDGDGVITKSIPNDAKSGILCVGDDAEGFPIKIGGLDPIDTTTGVQQRLSNLGYDCEESGEVDDVTSRAIQNFQAQHDLDVTGDVDDALKGKLSELSQ